MTNKIRRRRFMASSAGALFGASLAKPASSALTSPAPAPPERKPIDLVRIGFVGVGSVGAARLQKLLEIEGVRVTAICDIMDENAERAKKMIVEAGMPEPTLYTRSDRDFDRLCETEDLDVVYTATPWRWRPPVCVAAMKNGKHAVAEAPAAYTIEDCWQLVEISEKTGRHCIMTEDACYGKFEMTVLNVAHENLFGDLTHAECGHLDALPSPDSAGSNEAPWLPEHAIMRSGALYPPHGLGPIAQCMKINRGNQFDYLVSMSCAPKGLHEYAVERYGGDHEKAKETYKLGDIVTALIRTKAGQTILVQHDTRLARAQGKAVAMQGTRGMARNYPAPHIQIQSPNKELGAEDLDAYYKRYGRPLWTLLDSQTDAIADYRLINALRKGIAPDFDTYDAMAWSILGPLSEESIAQGSVPIKIPDFTRGMWKNPRGLQVMDPKSY